MYPTVKLYEVSSQSFAIVCNLVHLSKTICIILRLVCFYLITMIKMDQMGGQSLFRKTILWTVRWENKICFYSLFHWTFLTLRKSKIILKTKEAITFWIQIFLYVCFLPCIVQFSECSWFFSLSLENFPM